MTEAETLKFSNDCLGTFANVESEVAIVVASLNFSIVVSDAQKRKIYYPHRTNVLDSSILHLA